MHIYGTNTLGPIYFHLLPTLFSILVFSWPDPYLNELFTFHIILCYELVNAE